MALCELLRGGAWEGEQNRVCVRASVSTQWKVWCVWPQVCCTDQRRALWLVGVEARTRLQRWIWTPGLPAVQSAHWQPPFGSEHIRAQTGWFGKAARSQPEPPIEPTDLFPDWKASQGCFLSTAFSARLTVKAMPMLHATSAPVKWEVNHYKTRENMSSAERRFFWQDLSNENTIYQHTTTRKRLLFGAVGPLQKFPLLFNSSKN